MYKNKFIIVAGIVFASSSCGSDTAQIGEGFSDQQIVIDFADQVVVPTYALLSTRIITLQTSVDSLATDTTTENLAEAQDAWRAARVPWEQGEGFLFGPVASYGYDPAMDSWPVNKTDLDAVLATEDEFTSEYVAGLQETQKGFHTVEYLLFGEGNSKTADEITSREIEYLQAITDELVTVSTALHEAWTEGADGQTPYRDTFANAGQDGNTAYPSLTSAAQEILNGMIGICDEVANGKIADPYDAHDPTLVESQFAYNSLTDFQDNIRSVANAYTGGVSEAGTSGRGLSAYIVEIDSDLDTRLRSEIQAAIDAIAAIPDPFRDAISTPSAYDSIEAAQDAIRTVQTTLESDIQPLILQ